jgi:hypothetical protein
MSIDAALGRLGIQTGVCTSSTRPANPYEGQVIYETDTNSLRFWSGSAWESNKGAVISSAAPTSPAAGDIWYDSDDGRAYVYYDDGSSQQWVEFGAPPSGSTIALASYADSAARTTAIPSPTEADLSYLQDTNSVEVYDGSAWAAVGAGAILQVVTATYSTEEANTSTTFVATSLEASITPSSTDSKILVFASVPYRSDRASNFYSGEARFAIYRDNTTSLYESYTQKWYSSTAASDRDFMGNKEMIWLDSPSTTSSTTYTVYARGSTGQSLQVFDASSTGYLTLVEFG